jgi:hypothetical protein
MLQLVKKFKIFTVKGYWFADNLKFSLNSVYYQVPIKYNKLGYIRKSFHTFLIDLLQEGDVIFSNYKKNTSYEIRRAQKEGLSTQYEINKQKSIDFFNSFAKTKSLNFISLNNSNVSHSSFCVTSATYNGIDLVMHYYLKDIETGRVRLLYSATNVTNSSLDHALIGRANRLLHYNDMILFKNEGFKIYDLGGFAYNTEEKSLLGINSFKESFGGIKVKEYHYYSYVVYILMKWLKKI